MGLCCVASAAEGLPLKAWPGPLWVEAIEFRGTWEQQVGGVGPIPGGLYRDTDKSGGAEGGRGLPASSSLPRKRAAEEEPSTSATVPMSKKKPSRGFGDFSSW